MNSVTRYKVRLFDHGTPEVQMHDVDAQTPQEAAERLIGVPLTSETRAQIYLRADVRIVQKMNDHHLFFEVA